jgi:hypothetical protein
VLQIGFPISGTFIVAFAFSRECLFGFYMRERAYHCRPAQCSVVQLGAVSGNALHYSASALQCGTFKRSMLFAVLSV